MRSLTAVRGRLAALALVALIVTGCSSSADGAGDPGTDPSVAAPPSADPFTSALIMSRSWASAQMEAIVLSTVDGVSRREAAVGEVGVDKGYAQLTLSDGQRTSTEIVNDRGTFRQDQAPDGGWTYFPPGSATPTSALADPLRHLTQAEGITEQGTDVMDGFEATRYTGHLPLTRENLEGLALTQDQVIRLLDSASPGEQVDLTIWLDPNRRVVRVDRALETPATSAVPASILASTHLWNFGIMLHVEPPPSASVTATITAPR